MKLRLTILLLFFELCTLHGHVISKREATDMDRYAIKSNKDIIELINPKAKKPTLREIIFYHVIEKPYPDSKQSNIIKNDEIIYKNDNLIEKDDNKASITDFPRPWTNGHGFQYLNGNNIIDQNEADSAESLETQEPVNNDVTASSDIKIDELPDDEPQNDEKPKQEDSKNDQDFKEVKNDSNPGEELKIESNSGEEVRNNDLKEEKERPAIARRPVHIERPAKNDVDDIIVDTEVQKDDTLNNNKIADIGNIEDDKTIRFRDFITEAENTQGARRKREIDYSKMHDAPPLPLFKMDRFPEYIKEILPSDDDLEILTKTENHPSRTTEKPAYLSRTTEKPAYLSRSTEKPAYLSRTTEESLYLTERPEVARKPIHLSRTTEKPAFVSKSTEKPENFEPKISVRIGETDEQRMARKLARNIDGEIEKELDETVRQVAEAQDGNTKVENPSSGMNLIGNNGVVWNNLHGLHYKFNVGPDATDSEDHYAQIPVKPSTEKLESTTKKDGTTIDLSGEIQSALDEIGHIFEEILDQTDNVEDTNKATTENYDIHVNINKDHDSHDDLDENNKKPNDVNKEVSKENNDKSNNGQVKARTAEIDDDQVNLDQVMDFLQAIQDIVVNSQKNESNNEENGEKDQKIESRRESNKSDAESKPNDENKDESDAVKDLLNNKSYWEWLKDTSESYMNIIMKRVLGLIKEEVAKQIQHLVGRMLEEQGITPPGDNDKQQGKDDSHSRIDRRKDDKGNGEGNSGQSLKTDDKYWDWLKDSSEAYIKILMKRFLGEIAEGVSNQIDILADKKFKENGYTPPKKDKSIKKDTDNDEEDSKVIQTLKGNKKWKWLTKSSKAYLDKTMKRVNKLIEEEVSRQITHLVQYHMPSQNDEQTNKEENSNKKERSDVVLNDSDSKSEESSLRKSKQKLDEAKDEISDKKSKDKGKDKKKQKHEHKDKNKDKHNHEDAHKHDSDEHKNKEENPDKNVKISAKNAYGTSINNEKVTNIFIFAVNSTDLKKLKPISSGNGIFIFGTDNNDKDQNTDSNKQPAESNEITGNFNTDSNPNKDKVEITTATPIKDKEELDNTDSDLNKEEKDNSEKPEGNSETPEGNSEKPEENSETPEENLEKPEENSETPEENSETPEDNSEKTDDNPKVSSEENQAEDGEKSKNDSKNADSKDTKKEDKDLKDDDRVEIDERIGEIDEPKDKELKDSSENVKDKETNETTTEASSN